MKATRKKPYDEIIELDRSDLKDLYNTWSNEDLTLCSFNIHYLLMLKAEKIFFKDGDFTCVFTNRY